jgi:hypothetical protein
MDSLERPQRQKTSIRFGKWGFRSGTDLKAVRYQDADWINVSQNIDQWPVNTMMNISGSIKCWGYFDQLSNYWLLKRASFHEISLFFFRLQVTGCLYIDVNIVIGLF